ncbi:hypothetical protein [Shewanella colwelliana]|uniref:hypothetical protein n=1 Tax=Shewanella colwelliana TaxID=23 RepID=UPI0022AF8A35|nr:hypothetical protein [Shewanella colwelliana]MCZ4339914.1 hypothetical protein [Shewanella colwelliana]
MSIYITIEYETPSLEFSDSFSPFGVDDELINDLKALIREKCKEFDQSGEFVIYFKGFDREASFGIKCQDSQFEKVLNEAICLLY